MSDEPREDDEERRPDYDTRDPEVPIVLHDLPTRAHDILFQRKQNHAKHHIGIAFKWMTDCVAAIWRNTLWNRGFWTFAATIVMAVATAFYTFYARKQLKAINDQLPELRASAETAKTQLELEERPWVDARITLDGPLTFDVNGANIPLRFDLRNTGHSPALATDIQFLPVIGFGVPDAAQYRDKVCADAEANAVKYPYFGVALFPNGDPFAERWRVGIGKQDIERAGRELNNNGKITSIAVVSCIAYRPTFNAKSVYTTAYIVDLYKLDSENRPSINFTIGENVDQAHLSLRLHTANAITAK